MKKIIIGFDGLVRAGKSSTVKRLADVFDATIVDEYKGYATRAGLVFPSYPPKSYKKAIEASKFFINLEKQRYFDLCNYKLTDKKIFLTDRTCHSCIAFDYAANHYTKLGTFKEVEHLWQNTKKVVPDLNFFMDVSQTNLKKRMRLNGDVFPPHFSNKRFNGYMTKFFMQQCKKNKNMIRINANQTREKIDEDIKKVIKKYLIKLSK
ncbi:MAG: hypothetical protein ABIC04_06640 [Nanoarchaeota archaeon]